jgi:hypothetical protein
LTQSTLFWRRFNGAFFVFSDGDEHQTQNLIEQEHRHSKAFDRFQDAHARGMAKYLLKLDRILLYFVSNLHAGFCSV